MKLIGSHSMQGGMTSASPVEGCRTHIPGNGQPVEEKVMFVFGSVIFVALMAYGAALNVLFGSDVEDTFI